MDKEQLKKILIKANSLEKGKEISLAKEFISLDEKIDTVSENITTKFNILNEELKKKLDEELVYEIDEKKIVDSVLSQVIIPVPINGEKGEKGDRGEIGNTGKQGIKGKDGIDGIDGKDGKDGSPDTRQQIIEKINIGRKNDLKIQVQQIEGIEKLAQTNFDRAIGILDQRTQFLINKRNSLNGLTGDVTLSAGTNISLATVGNTITINNTQSLSGYVPYTGATTNVDLGVYTLTTPTVIGGTAVSSDLTLRSTSGVGDDTSWIIHQVANNGSVETMREGVALSPDATATGGTITTSGGYTIHTFTSGGTFTVSGGSLSVDYLIVAGGGGGGAGNGGGGGAGGLLSGSALSCPVGAYTITIGSGGSGGTNAAPAGVSGGNSTALGFTASGGGGGGYYSAVAGLNGGSGGGGGPSTASGGTGTGGQGNNGGTGQTAGNYRGGGGGGAGAAGATGAASGNGGIGTSSSISGSATYYAGGGGGGSQLVGSNSSGGNGGGGAGVDGIAGQAGTNATANTGGGGGGSAGYGATRGNGGNGGSGVVIIRYPTPSTTKRPVIGINKPVPTAMLHIGAGTGNLYSGQLQFDPGALLNNPVAGTIEYKTGAFVLQSDALLMGGGTSLLSTETLSIQKNQSGLTYGLISNTTSATTAQAAFQTLTNAGLGLSMRALSPAYTTSGIKVASTSVLSSDQLAGLNIGTTSATQLSLWTNNTERARFLSTGEFLVGETTQTNLEFMGVRKDQNNLTLLRVHNATSGTAAKTMQGTSNATSSIFLQVQSAGFTSSGMEVADTAAVYANAVGGLNIGTYNATQTSFWTNSVERARFLSTGEFGIGTTAPTAILHLKAGSDITNGSPFKFTSGTLTTGGNMSAGAMEFLTDSLYYTTTTGTKRRMIVAGTTGRATAQTAANTSVATYTLGATDASYEVSANVLVTTSSAENFTVTVDYTDEGNTARTITLNFQIVGGTIGTAINFANGAVPYEGIPLHIRCKASTAITVKTTGTFTGATYNVEGIIKQTA